MISLVMATYNGEKYLYEQLDSIRCQTMPPDEVIICDDCSKDSTVNMIQEYIDKYQLKHWNVYENEKNCSSVAGRSHGIDNGRMCREERRTD